MSYSDKCNLLNGNPVIVARHFQYRIELSFRVIVLDGLLEKTNYHAIRVEFPVTWKSTCLFFYMDFKCTISSDNNPLQSLLNGIFGTDLSDADKEPELFDLVKNYQIHKHSKTCQKFKNKSFRFYYG